MPPATLMRVELVSGCAALLELDPELSDQGVLACFEKVLVGARWDCLGDTACALIETSPR